MRGDRVEFVLVYPWAVTKTAASAEPLRGEALVLMGGHIGVPLLFFIRLIFTRLVFTRGWTYAAALAWCLPHASVNDFLQGRGAVKGEA